MSGKMLFRLDVSGFDDLSIFIDLGVNEAGELIDR